MISFSLCRSFGSKHHEYNSRTTTIDNSTSVSNCKSYYFNSCSWTYWWTIQITINQNSRSYPDRRFRSPDPERSCRKTPEIAETCKQYSSRKLSRFFRWIPANFLCFRSGTSRNTASMFQRFPGFYCWSNIIFKWIYWT